MNPYPGLRPFREEEEYLFFGRERQVDVLGNHPTDLDGRVVGNRRGRPVEVATEAREPVHASLTGWEISVLPHRITHLDHFHTMGYGQKG